MNRDRRPPKPAHELTAAELKKFTEDERALDYCEDIQKAMNIVVMILQAPNDPELRIELDKIMHGIVLDSFSWLPFDIGIEVPERLECYYSRNITPLEDPVLRSPEVFVAEFIEPIDFRQTDKGLAAHVVFGNRKTNTYLVIEGMTAEAPIKVDQLMIKPVEKSLP
jgi:hypothetical protein